ncbi:24942_t:CDS:2 [Racocetra persica]|uniref:24942_t:CDS:1 n=1 Tax=Racocetra persica TaxID=160502 RepID=A0ACA9PAN1_9GLOM|nr:24942_t:CDS:2 [Racocetra persica]
MQQDGKLNSESALKLNSNLDFKVCSCAQKVLKDDWEDHQIVCPRRRLTCPAFVSFLSGISKFEQPYWKIYGERYAEFSLSSVESNCPPTLKELTKLQILQSIGNLDELKTNKIPSAIIHTLRWECPTFSTKAELNKHLVGACFYYKVQCLFSPIMRPGLYNVHATNCHNNNMCLKLELSRQEFHAHSSQAALDPISQRLPSTPHIFPYHCSLCDHCFLNSDTHICMPSPPIPEYDIICHCCKSKLVQPKKTHHEIENACQVCCNQDNNNPTVIGMVGMVSFHNQKNYGIENQKMQWKNVKRNIIKSNVKTHETEASINDS